MLPSHSSRAHARLSPSGAAKWIRCALSLQLEETLPPEGPKPYAEWGTKCHEIAEADLLGKPLPEDAEPEQYEVAKFYADYCRSLGGGLSVESRVNLEAFSLPEVEGTLDASTVVDDILYIIDLKAGMMPVGPGSPQLKIYALGMAGAALLDYSLIRLVIVQPRTEPQIKTFDVDPLELFAWLNNVLNPAVEATKQPNPSANPSEEACRWCQGKPICVAYSERVTALAQQSFADFAPKDIKSLTSEHLAAIVPHIGEIEKYLKALKDHAKSYMEQGGLIPGLKLVAGRRSARKWIDEEEARKYLIRKVGKDNLYDLKIKSPAKVEALLKGTKHKVDHLTEQKEGSPTIVSADDKREAITSTAALAFKEYTS